MTRAAKGWKVVCPDGRVRHYPYRSVDDAQAAAEASGDSCDGIRRTDDGMPQPPCCGGPHVVRRTSFDDAPLTGPFARS